MRVHVRTIQRFSMREEDTHGSWKRLYLKLAAPLGAFMGRKEREREGGRFTSGKLDSMLLSILVAILVR